MSAPSMNQLYDYIILFMIWQIFILAWYFLIIHIIARIGKIFVNQIESNREYQYFEEISDDSSEENTSDSDYGEYISTDDEDEPETTLSNYDLDCKQNTSSYISKCTINEMSQYQGDEPIYNYLHDIPYVFISRKRQKIA